jgi:hypothetical protein
MGIDQESFQLLKCAQPLVRNGCPWLVGKVIRLSREGIESKKVLAHPKRHKHRCYWKVFVV